MKLKVFVIILALLLVPATTFAQSSQQEPEVSHATIALTQIAKKVDVSPSQYTSSYNYNFYLDGNQITVNEPVINYGGRVYLPLRAVGQAMDSVVSYNSQYKVAIAQLGDSKVEIPVKTNTGVKIKNGIATTAFIDQSNQNLTSLLVNSKTYIPVRFTGEALGLIVTYDGITRSIHFTTSGNTPPVVTLTQPSQKSKYIGIKYGGDILPEGVTDYGGWLIEEPTDPYTYALAHMAEGDKEMIWLERLTHRDAQGRAYWEVLDVITLPQMKQNQVLCVDVLKDGNWYSGSFVIAEYEDEEILTEVYHAWVVDKEIEKIKEIPVDNIAGINEGYGI